MLEAAGEAVRVVSRTSDHADMAVHYFASTYFSLEQAMTLDFLRQVIDREFPATPDRGTSWEMTSLRDVYLSAWLLAAHSVANTTGHGAQFLKATERGHARVLSAWAKPVFPAFARAYERVMQRNGLLALEGNLVSQCDARAFLSQRVGDVSVVYADPPYTKDQYSRMYHLHETLYQYDWPSVAGVGIARADRPVSDFSLKRRALEGIRDIARGASDAGCVLILSYPDNGLVQLSLSQWEEVLTEGGREIDVVELDVNHSTFGGRSGRAQKLARERLFVVQ